MTLLHFLGRGTSYRPYYGTSGKRYLFGGKHHATGYVLDSDAKLLLSMFENGRHLFEVAKPAKVVKPVVVEPAQPTLIEKVKATLDTGKTVIMNKSEVVAYQQKHPKAIFTKIEPYVPTTKKAGKKKAE